uniref:Phorbol-ester/DAG-type domain-containing protein n=1 Tax=Homalodisca liturata TaxID=320908 RepID=A0A1B6K740_9HEMI
MEITKSLHDDIVKIQHELVTAIQNHQVLVLRQQVSPTDSIRTQIEEVQRHIICLGESQKILVARLRNEVDPRAIRASNKHKTPHPPRPQERFNHRGKSEDIARSLLVKNAHKDRSRFKPTHRGGNDNAGEQKASLPKGRHPSIDSSSEENRTPCESPINGNSDNEKKGAKRNSVQSRCQPAKRPKTTLQATPRPSSPAKALDVLTSSSEESLDSLVSQQPESENKVEFALALGLITQEVYSRIIKKKSERRRRKVNTQHHLYDDLWDLTMLQKRNSRVKEPVEYVDDGSRDCGTPLSDSDSLCFVCRNPGIGEQRECRVCQTMCHVSCVTGNICPACTHQAPSSPLITEKKKELEQLRLSNKELHKSVSKLRERANELSASLVQQTARVNQLVSEEEKLLESIKIIKDFIAGVQNSPKLTS